MDIIYLNRAFSFTKGILSNSMLYPYALLQLVKDIVREFERSGQEKIAPTPD
jgi:hypothetical protein